LRAVTTATAAAVIGIERKALDNMLSRLDESVVPKGRQGVERRVPISLLVDLVLTTELIARLGAPVREAFALAQRLARGDSELGPFLSIQADLERIRLELDRQLEVAIESVVRRPRGRPRRA